MGAFGGVPTQGACESVPRAKPAPRACARGQRAAGALRRPEGPPGLCPARGQMSDIRKQMKVGASVADSRSLR